MIENFVDFVRNYSKSIKIDGNRLSVSHICTEALAESIIKIKNERFNIEEILIDGDEVEVSDLSESIDREIEITIVIPTNGIINVFSSIKQLITNAKSILSGKMLDEYYIFDIDYYSKDDCEPVKELLAIISICKLIKSLGELAHYHDTKLGHGYNSFVFIHENESNTSHPVVLQPVITSKLLELPPIDISLFNEVENENVVIDPHAGKEKALFRVSIVEFSSQFKNISSSDLFELLIVNWEDFKKIFQRNLDTYISGFAFDKARKEVAEAEFGLADQYSKVIGDISGKLFGLPISFVAVFALFDKDTFWLVEIIILTALFTASWLMAKLVQNQKTQLERINHAKGLSFDSLINNAINYPHDLKEKLEEANTGLNDSYDKLDKLLLALSYLVWLPFAITFYILAIKYAYQFGCYLSKIICIGL